MSWGLPTLSLLLGIPTSKDHILCIHLGDVLFKKFFWSVVALQCCISFKCAAKWFTYICVCVCVCVCVCMCAYMCVCIYSCCCSVAQVCPTLCDPMDCSIPGFLVLHHLLELAQTHVHWVGDAIQPSHPLSSPPPVFNFTAKSRTPLSD